MLNFSCMTVGKHKSISVVHSDTVSCSKTLLPAREAEKMYLLGGDAPHMAGDGLGLVLRPSPGNRPLPSDYEVRQASVVSQVPQGSRQSCPVIITLQDSVHLPSDPQDSTRAPRCSKANDATAPAQLRSPFPESTTLPSTRVDLPGERKEVTEKKKGASWQDFEIPEELSMVDDSVTPELKNIIQESFEKQKALQISRMQPRADDEDVSEYPDPSSKNQSVAIEERSAIASTPVSGCVVRKESAFFLSEDSNTTPGSDTPDFTYLQPPKLTRMSPAFPRHRLSGSKSDQVDPLTSSPSPAMTGIEARFHEARDRVSKVRGIYSLFARRRMKPSVPSIPLMKPEPPSCECTSCFDDIPHEDAVGGLACRHKYCHPCFAQLVNTSILNEDSFPQKCCLTEIPKLVMQKNLSPLELSKFDQSSLEYAVPLASRHYCVAPEYARWIDVRVAKRTNGALECPHCATKLCTVCRGPQHPGNQDCPQDYGLDATLREAEQAR